VRAATLWIWTGVNLILLALFAPRVGESGDHLFSYLILAGIGLLVGATALRRTLHRSQSRIRSIRDLVWSKLRANRSAMAGMVVIIALLYLAMLAPFLAPADPYAINWASVAGGPTAQNVFGTDDMGRDVLSRAIFGLRIVLGVAVLAVIANMLLGTVLGLLAGYYGGVVDSVIMRILEMWNSIPFILLAIALMAALGTGLLNLVLVVSLTSILPLARLIRGQVLVIKKSQFVDAARVMGVPGVLILSRHVLPHCIAPIVVMATLKVGETILTISGLSFLGLGIQPPTPSLGAMLSVGQQYLYNNVLMSIVPGVLILLTVLNFNLFGDGLRDAFDARIKR
jgi:ABC-type dipeptide/oligopeptide/nickel transport system permease subunit